LNPKILSLNCGTPALMEWNGQSVISSMLRKPVTGPLVVHRDHIEGNSFQAPQWHGVEYAVLYAFGMKSIHRFLHLLNRQNYEPGELGENITLDDLDESKISVGDIFQIGAVKAQAVYPRIPCSKVNIRMQHSRGQKAMQECGRSGVYFRILEPGEIHLTDSFRLVEESKHRFLISELYYKVVNGIQFNEAEMKRALANGAFPQKVIGKWTPILKG